MKRAVVVLALGLVFGSASAEVKIAVETEKREAAATMPPTRVTDQPEAILNALKRNDFAAFLEATEDDKDIGELAEQWDRHAAELRELAAKTAEVEAVEGDVPREPSESERLWQRLSSAGGVEGLVKEWQPMIAEASAKKKMEFNLGFGALLTSIAQDQELTALEVQQLTQLMYAAQDWSGRVDFADENRLRRALTAVSELVQRTGVARFDDLQQLPFEDAMVHGDALLRTVKRVLAAYDLDADQILNSVRLHEVDAHGDHATLHAEIRVFGVDLSHDFKLACADGRWIDADLAEASEQRRREVEAAALEIAPPEAPEPPAAPAAADAASGCDVGMDAAAKTEAP